MNVIARIRWYDLVRLDGARYQGHMLWSLTTNAKRNFRLLRLNLL